MGVSWVNIYRQCMCAVWCGVVGTGVHPLECTCTALSHSTEHDNNYCDVTLKGIPFEFRHQRVYSIL